MLIRIDPQSPDPIFEQIILQVKSAAARGELRSGDKLPSVRELAKELVVNPNTVIRAFEGLERDGVVVRRQGSGCFVKDLKSGLRETERKRLLGRLVRKMLTESYHLGCTPVEIKAILEEELKSLRYPKDGSDA